MVSQDHLLGKTVNGYQINGVIGRGGMATVYKATQLSMERVVAMKVLPRQYIDDSTYIQRFNREVNIVSQLEHRSIIPVYDYGEYDRQPYIVMRYMPAGSMDELLAAGPIPLDVLVDVYRQIAPALDYAHSKNILHRDLKPSNVLLDDHNGAYLTDFGIARILGEATGSTITTQGVVGTPAYMSPEQAQGKPLDGRSDLYSLGVMLFEMVTGRRPFEGDTPYGVAVMQVTTPPPRPRDFHPAVAESVEQVIFKAMAKNPAHRYQTAVELADALQKAQENQDVFDTQPRPVYKATKPAPAPTVATPPPAPGYAVPPPYSAPASQPKRPHESSWIPQVRPARRPRRRDHWAAKFAIGVLIGCALLTLLAAVMAVMVVNLNDLFDDGTLSTPDISAPAGSIVTIEPSPLIEPTAIPPTEEIAPTVPPPTATTGNPTAVPPPTSTRIPPTATFAPIGERG